MKDGEARERGQPFGRGALRTPQAQDFLNPHTGLSPRPLAVTLSSFQLRNTQSFWLQKLTASATSLWKSSPSWKTRDRQPVASRGGTRTPPGAPPQQRPYKLKEGARAQGSSHRHQG